MLVISRFRIDEGSAGDGSAHDRRVADDFVARAHTALAVLAARPGYVAGRLGRSLDEPEYWCLVTEWESVGAYRRALSAYDVKVSATPLLAEATDEPSAYEVLALAAPGGDVLVERSDRA